MPESSALSVNVFVTPMRPFAGAPAGAPGDEPNWSPMSSTLISGDHDGVLVDTLVTFDQADALADWVEAQGKNITTIFVTHGHADHWIGLARLLERFPNARGLASPAVLDRARFEATDPGVSKYWATIFAGEIPSPPVLPELLDGDTIDLEGTPLTIIPLGQGDTEHSDIVSVPSIGLVVGGDIVYNGVHMMTAETTPGSRETWISNLNAIAALDPKIVVAGHKRVGAADSPSTIEESQRYLRDFSRIVAESSTTEEVVHAMLELHGDRDNQRTLWHSARTAIAQKG